MAATPAALGAGRPVAGVLGDRGAAVVCEVREDVGAACGLVGRLGIGLGARCGLGLATRALLGLLDAGGAGLILDDLEDGQRKGGGLARAGLRGGDHVAPGEDVRDGLRLDGGRRGETEGADALEDVLV